MRQYLFGAATIFKKSSRVWAAARLQVEAVPSALLDGRRWRVVDVVAGVVGVRLLAGIPALTRNHQNTVHGPPHGTGARQLQMSADTE